MISIDDFKKVEIKVGKILSAEKVDGSEKLLRLSVDFRESKPRQVISGIAKYKNPDSLVDKSFAFVTNLEPREIMGFKSEAMIMAFSPNFPAPKEGEFFSLMEIANDVPPGTRAK
jgi:methionine--tRNA ligase beta chain